MKKIGLIIWHFPILGFVNAFITYSIGVVFIITVVGLPLGYGLLEIAKFLLKPTVKVLKVRVEPVQQFKDLWAVFGFFVRILYLPFGIFLVNLLLIQIAILYISIVGIPLAKMLIKSVPVIFNPVNKVCLRSTYIIK